MDRNKVLLGIGIFLLITTIMVYKAMKKRLKENKPIWTMSIITMFVLFCVFIIFPLLIECDVDGNVYSLFSKYQIWECATYYTEDHQAYYSNGEYLFNKENPHIKYEFSQSYLTSKGYLVFDQEEKYCEIKCGVFVDENNERVYDLYSGNWDLFGKFRNVEGKGIQFGKDYIVAYQADLYDNDMAYNLETLLLMVSMLPIILFIFSALQFFKYYWNFFLKAKKLPKKVSYKISKYVMIFMIPATQMMYNEIVIMHSLFLSFIWITISTIIIYLYIPYEEGETNRIDVIQDENEAWYESRSTYPLKVMRETTDEVQAKEWQRLYLLVIGISYGAWIILSIITSIGM